jgi:ketosteroid isomerase-like protein
MSEQSTTRDLVELWRRAAEAYNRRDWDAWVSMLSPDVVYRPAPISPETRERQGRDDVRRFHEEFLEAWADDFVANLDTVRIYGDAVIARSVLVMRGRAAWRFPGGSSRWSSSRMA